LIVGNIKLVKPEKASMLENHIIQMARGGQINTKLTEGQLIGMLERISGGEVDQKPQIIVIPSSHLSLVQEKISL